MTMDHMQYEPVMWDDGLERIALWETDDENIATCCKEQLSDVSCRNLRSHSGSIKTTLLISVLEPLWEA